MRATQSRSQGQVSAPGTTGSPAPVEASRRASQQATQEAIDVLVANNFNPDNVGVYKTEEEVMKALEAGEVAIGDAVVVDGKPLILQEEQ